MDISIRAQRPGDEPALEALLTAAFDNYSDGAGILPPLQRYWPGWDPRLSLVATDGERLLGHVLGLTAAVRLRGATRLAMSVGPVCVEPAVQRQGLGGRLLTALHEAGRLAGAEFVLLAGVPSYYPQHGYRPCHGFANLTIQPDALPAGGPPLRATPVSPADLPWLTQRQAAELAEVDFGWLWPGTLDCWRLSGVNAVCWRDPDGRLAAYTLAKPNSPFEPPRDATVLAANRDDALAALRAMRPASLAHHPAGWLAREVLRPEFATTGPRAVHPALMARELVPGALADYFAAVDSGGEPGLVNWPLPFWLG
ncbi:MAG: N-acetyltransferase [Fimbriimonadaceae bacterium]|nr:N-acetyltransferase [Fimbriimonadaceae bacterium]